MRVVRILILICTYDLTPHIPQAKIPVRSTRIPTAFISISNRRFQFVARMYSATRMDTVWALRQAYVVEPLILNARLNLGELMVLQI